MRAGGIQVGVDQRFEDALSQVDAVIIATPPTSHASLAMKAIAAGKHVLIEKPMATIDWPT